MRAVERTMPMRSKFIVGMIMSTIFLLSGGTDGQQVLSRSTFARCAAGTGPGNGILIGPPGPLFVSSDGVLVSSKGVEGASGLLLVNFAGSGGKAGPAAKLAAGRIGSAVQGVDGGVYFTDLERKEVRRWMKGNVHVVAGHKVPKNFPLAAAKGALASFRLPTALVTDAELNIFVSDTADHRVRRITRRNNVAKFLAGASDPRTNAGVEGFRDGPGNSAAFSSPNGLFLFQGTLYVADTGNNAIRTVDPSSGTVATLYPPHSGSGDGKTAALVRESRPALPGASDGAAAGEGGSVRGRIPLKAPEVLCVVAPGFVLVLESRGERIVQISLATGRARELLALRSPAAGLAFTPWPPPEIVLAHGGRDPRRLKKIAEAAAQTEAAGWLLVSSAENCAVEAIELSKACDGAAFSDKELDRCGVCGGEDECVDCAGVPFGWARRDRCGVCNGDSSSCVAEGVVPRTYLLHAPSACHLWCIFRDPTYGAVRQTVRVEGALGDWGRNRLAQGSDAQFRLGSVTAVGAATLSEASFSNTGDKSQYTDEHNDADGGGDRSRSETSGVSLESQQAARRWAEVDVTTLVGDGSCGRSNSLGDRSASGGGRLNRPSGVAIDEEGRVFVADTDNNRIRGIHVCESSDGSVAKEDPEGTAKRCSDDQIIKRLLGTKAAAKQALEVQLVIVAGSGEPGLRDGPAHAARFDSPTGLAVRGGAGDEQQAQLLVADSYNGALRTVALTGRGTGAGAVTSVDFGHAAVSSLRAVCVGKGGDVYLSDSQTKQILRLPRHGGSAAQVGSASFALGAPRGIALAPRAARGGEEGAEWLVVADEEGRVLRIAVHARGDGGEWEVLARKGDKAQQGQSVEGRWEGGLAGDGVRLSSPVGVAAREDGIIFVADEEAHAVFALQQVRGEGSERGARDEGAIGEAAGSAAESRWELVIVAGGGVPGTRDGRGLGARLRGPYALALEHGGQAAVVADRGDCALRLLTRLPPLVTDDDKDDVQDGTGGGKEGASMGSWGDARDTKETAPEWDKAGQASASTVEGKIEGGGMESSGMRGWAQAVESALSEELAGKGRAEIDAVKERIERQSGHGQGFAGGLKALEAELARDGGGGEEARAKIDQLKERIEGPIGGGGLVRGDALGRTDGVVSGARERETATAHDRVAEGAQGDTTVAARETEELAELQALTEKGAAGPAGPAIDEVKEKYAKARAVQLDAIVTPLSATAGDTKKSKVDDAKAGSDRENSGEALESARGTSWDEESRPGYEEARAADVDMFRSGVWEVAMLTLAVLGTGMLLCRTRFLRAPRGAQPPGGTGGRGHYELVGAAGARSGAAGWGKRLGLGWVSSRGNGGYEMVPTQNSLGD